MANNDNKNSINNQSNNSIDSENGVSSKSSFTRPLRKERQGERENLQASFSMPHLPERNIIKPPMRPTPPKQNTNIGAEHSHAGLPPKRDKSAFNRQPIVNTLKSTKTNERDLDQKKEKRKGRWLLLIMLIPLSLILVVFLIWGDEIFNPQTIYYFDPQGNDIEIDTQDPEIALADFRFMPGDTVDFVNNISIHEARKNNDGENNSMFAFRFRVFIEIEGERTLCTSDVIGVQRASIVFHRGYYYYTGIIVPGGSSIDIIESIELSNSLGNEYANKVGTLVFDFELTYPSEDQIYENFGSFPLEWYIYVTVMGEALMEEGY